jgi:PAS domain S-box-containing protein
MLLGTASDGVHILSAAGEVVEVSDSFCTVLGYRRDDVIGMRPSLWDVRLSEIELCNVISRVSAGELKRFVTRHRRKSGSIIDVEINADCFELDGEQYLYCSARDTTEQKRLERAVLETANREQAKLGHDLHDGLGQELAGISMLTSALAVSERRAGRPAADGLAQLKQLTRRTIATCRAVAHGLSPLSYADGGLVEAMREMVSVQRDAYGAETHFEVISADPLRLSADTMEHLYRIAQEAVTNATRHARARIITVTLDVEPPSVRLEVLDDGISLPSTGTATDGMGLRIMASRAEMIGGQLSIGPGDHGGTLVACECPQSA